MQLHRFAQAGIFLTEGEEKETVQQRNELATEGFLPVRKYDVIS